MAEPGTQQPKRPKGFYASVMLDWREASLRRELTDQEQVTVAAQYLGLAIAKLGVSVESQLAVMDTAAKITNTACLARTAVKQGVAWPVEEPEPCERGRERAYYPR